MLVSKLPPLQNPVCPIPIHHTDQIMIGHGSGGRMTHELIQKVFQPHFSPTASQNPGNDFSAVKSQPGDVVVSTDSHIVSPLFFPGGDIGRLAVCGTVNDVAMSGGIPLYLTAGFILEEGLPMETLERVVASMQAAADEAGVRIIAGDTKVVEKGKADLLFINTTGLGFKQKGFRISGDQAREGDVVLLSGFIGNHGMAVLSARGDLGFSSQIHSDVAPLNDLIQELLKAAPHVNVLRDPTRGGLATTLNEIALQSHVSIALFENQIPVEPAVRSACEMLGFDPLYVANEGKVVVIVPREEAEPALNALKSHRYGINACVIGEVIASNKERVLLKTLIGGTRILDMLTGEMLPRIC
jgi:hydrogenase expression/formation protein HypE